ncbi:NAD-dependent epimerase/dehydratase family protein [Streptomyces profundus]|uniref:NAD-dependent epimerase/dehydratase family protein n=1 Tax=Streptomyces profundus TaxID=2867410 RepID=UPI001D1601C5|nr:NAD(P)-dependent oxidoreductase [Streptomyces sp. MA3_2.13]UED84963.1 NAD(P)-dependent oxidoreductase [Streptomyces sp. MA3_2.13]
MRVLVTGATGQVGRRFLPRLLRWSGPDQVRVLVRDAGRAGPFPGGFPGGGVEPHVGDLRDTAGLPAALAGVDAVVHIAAAFRGVPDEEARAVNLDATLALAEAALAAGARRFVFASTNLVYGAGRGRPAVETDEATADGILRGAYPDSKAEAERGLLRLHAERGLDVRIARLSFVYGDGDPHIEQSLHWTLGWAAHQRLQLVHHADVAQALRLLLRAPGIGGRIFNVADDAPVSAVEVLELTGTPIPDGMADRPLADAWDGIVSNRRIRDELGFRPLYPSLWTARDAGSL